MPATRLFAPFSLGCGFVLRNRIVMAPMTTWAADDDGTVSDQEVAHYRLRAKDVGLVITGCSHVQPNGVGFTGEFSADDDRFVPSLKRLATAAKSGGAPVILQLFHAGVKTHPDLVSDIVASSAVAGDAGPFAPSVTPRMLDEVEILEVVRAFGEATRRAIEAGFDGVELHGAHGFLIENFLSPHFNRRNDRWGGSLDNRIRFALAVTKEVRRVIAEHADRPFMLGYRTSLEDWHDDGLRIADSLVLVDRLIEAGIDYLHASLTDALGGTSIDGADGPPMLQILHDYLAGRVPLIAAGMIRTPEQAERALASGLSLVAIGKALVMNPDWVALARAGRSDAIARDIAAEDAPRLSVPSRLWSVIEATPGWFDIRDAA